MCFDPLLEVVWWFCSLRSVMGGRASPCGAGGRLCPEGFVLALRYETSCSLSAQLLAHGWDSGAPRLPLGAGESLLRVFSLGLSVQNEICLQQLLV